MPAPVSIRMNNPGALNVAPWVKAYPGYVSNKVTTAGNATVAFETPTHGVAAWWELLRRYRALGAITLTDVIYRYCGKGREREAAEYLTYVTTRTKLPGAVDVPLYDDRRLLAVARAFFRYEAGVESPLSDDQIVEGFRWGRAWAEGRPGAPSSGEKIQPPPGEGSGGRISPPWAPKGLLGVLWRLLAPFLRR